MKQREMMTMMKKEEVEENIWRACAGNLVKIPAVNSTAYYFPQGHVEQSSTLIPLSSLSPLVISKPSIPCRVLHVSRFADHDTDEVYAKIQLQPLASPQLTAAMMQECSERENGVVAFAKVLTPSDANNGGGFSVPRFCADAIFPPLDFNADPPVQNIRITDVHGNSWDFRHIYRGTPRRHLLTTGWSKFVNSKKLVAGDSVVFMKNKFSGELFVGVRRAHKVVNCDAVVSCWMPPVQYGARNGGGKGRVAAEKVVEAAERAASEMVFEVAYYPRPGVPEFVVEAEKVERSMIVCWNPGMRVKMGAETEDSSRMQWFQGTVAAVSGPENGVFRGSAWRMIEIAWDDPEILPNMKRVSPWQVELVAPTPPIHTTFPPTKKFRCSQNPGLLTNGEGVLPLPSVGLSSMIPPLSSSYLNFNFPAGMQGARQYHFLLSSLPNTMNEGARQVCPNDHVDIMSQKVEPVSTDLNIGNSPSETPSPDSQNSVQFFNTTTTDQPSSNLTRKSGITSFQLFGKTIQMEQPPTSRDEMSRPESDGLGAEDTKKVVDHSLADPFKKLHDRLGSQCQRSPVVEAYVHG